MWKARILFICIHNSARSQMAEAFLKRLAGDRFEVASAGLEAGTLNPLAVEVMQEIGIDISMNKVKSVHDLHGHDRRFDKVITVCDESSAAQCPIFPGLPPHIHWSLEDPSAFTGSYEERLEKTRRVRDEIKNKIKECLREYGLTTSSPPAVDRRESPIREA